MDNLTKFGSVNGLLVNGLWYGIGRCVPYLIQAAKLLLAAALGDYRPEVSLDDSALSGEVTLVFETQEQTNKHKL